MRLTDLAASGKKVSFVLHASHAEANAVRVALLEYVKSFAIHEVRVVTNTTGFPSEMIAKRIGMVPLLVKDQTLPSLIDCAATLQIEGKRQAMSDDIVFSMDAVSALKGIQICYVPKGSSLLVNCSIRSGTGEEHAIWQQASAVAFGEKPRVRVRTPAVDLEEAHRLARLCPRGVFSDQLAVEREDRCIDCGSCGSFADVWTDPASDGLVFRYETVSEEDSFSTLRLALSGLSTRLIDIRRAVSDASGANEQSCT